MEKGNGQVVSTSYHESTYSGGYLFCLLVIATTIGRSSLIHKCQPDENARTKLLLDMGGVVGDFFMSCPVE